MLLSARFSTAEGKIHPAPFLPAGWSVTGNDHILVPSVLRFNNDPI